MPDETTSCVGCHKDNQPLPRYLSDYLGFVLSNPDFSDVRVRNSRHLMFNLTRPEKSLILLAPLARKAGGYGLCTPKDGGVALVGDLAHTATQFQESWQYQARFSSNCIESCLNQCYQVTHRADTLRFSVLNNDTEVVFNLHDRFHAVESHVSCQSSSGNIFSHVCRDQVRSPTGMHPLQLIRAAPDWSGSITFWRIWLAESRCHARVPTA